MLALDGARRSQSKLDAAVAAIRADTSRASLDTVLLDLGSLASIAAAAARIAESETVDLLDQQRRRDERPAARDHD